MVEMSDADYRRLFDFRIGLRRFLQWSEEQAASLGMTPAQHQLLLAVKAHGDSRGPTIGDVAHGLLLRHHSAVGLVDRAEAAGLVRRESDAQDARMVRIGLTSLGARRLGQLAASHLQELDRLVPRLRSLWKGLDRNAVP